MLTLGRFVDHLWGTGMPENKKMSLSCYVKYTHLSTTVPVFPIHLPDTGVGSVIVQVLCHSKVHHMLPIEKLSQLPIKYIQQLTAATLISSGSSVQTLYARKAVVTYALQFAGLMDAPAHNSSVLGALGGVQVCMVSLCIQK